MAIMTGMKCLHCNKRKAKPDSHYCGKKCSTAFVNAKQGPVECVGGHGCCCDASCDSVSHARSGGWKSIRPSPEGISYNYTGYCPECVREGWCDIGDEQGDLFA